MESESLDMSTPHIPAGLFGLNNSNRDFTKPADWGKNKFNNAFPAALACYIGSKNLDVVYICLDGNSFLATSNRIGVIQKRLTIAELFGLQELSRNLFFSFETQYLPYLPLVTGNLPRIDLVTLDTARNNQALHGLEIKLTALPDNQTYNLPEDQYSCEIVIRPDTIVYLGLSIASAYIDDRATLFNLLDPACSSIKSWADNIELFPKLSNFITSLDNILLPKLHKESPLILQPVWKTIGKKSLLHDSCFDLFVWSNFGFSRLFVDSALRSINSITRNPRAAEQLNEINRHGRAVVWLAKMLYDFSKVGNLIMSIYLQACVLALMMTKLFLLLANKLILI